MLKSVVAIPDIVQIRGGLRFRLTNPTLVRTARKGVGGTVSFTLRVEDAVSAIPFLDVFGFRVLRGRVYPPARRAGASWYNQAQFSELGEAAVRLMVREWAGAFPSVVFPAAGSETGSDDKTEMEMGDDEISTDS